MADGGVVPDATIVRVMRRQLGSDAVTAGQIPQVECDRGVVTLSGEVPSVLVKERAVAVAHVVRGVRVVVDELDVSVRPRPDYELETYALAVLARDPVTARARLSVRARQGVLSVHGSVDSPAARRAAIEDLRGIPGVHDVFDELTVAPSPRGPTLVQAEVERAVLDDPWVDGSQILVWADSEGAHLSGFVVSRRQLVHAIADAQSAHPTAVYASDLRVVPLANDGTLRTGPVPAHSDADLRRALLDALVRDDRILPFVPGVDVHDGTVVLTGVAPDARTAFATDEDAHDVAGISKVDDLVELPPSPSGVASMQGGPATAVGPADDPPPSVEPAPPSLRGGPPESKVPFPIQQTEQASVALYAALARADWSRSRDALQSLQGAIRSVHAEVVGDSSDADELVALGKQMSSCLRARDQLPCLRAANETALMAANLSDPYAPLVPTDVDRLEYYARAVQVSASVHDVVGLRENRRRAALDVAASAAARHAGGAARRGRDLRSRARAARGRSDREAVRRRRRRRAPGGRRHGPGICLMTHISYGLFDDAAAARAAVDALESSGTPCDHCGVVMHENHLDRTSLGVRETRAASGSREVGVLNGILGAAIGTALVGPVGLVAGGALGALLGAIGGAVAGAEVPDRKLEKLSRQLADGKVLVIVEAPTLASREAADAAMRARGALVEHRPFF